MNDITEKVNDFRECVRHLWNSYFYKSLKNSTDDDDLDAFGEVYEKLFTFLVTSKIGEGGWEYFSNAPYDKPIPFLSVVPANESVSVIVSRPQNQGPQSTSWGDDSLSELSKSDAILHLIDLFDFDENGHRNFSYYKTRIVSFPKHPELEGRMLLIDTANARIFHSPAG